MLSRAAQHTTYNGNSQFSISTVCETRIDLLDRLAEILASLGSAKLELTSTGENSDLLRYESARFEVERLRGDCNRIKNDLESHRAQHGC